MDGFLPFKRNKAGEIEESWAGSIQWEAVCPGCQLAEWHPQCESVRLLSTGERIDMEALARGEHIVVTTIAWGHTDGVPVLLRSPADAVALGTESCHYVDLSVSWIDAADWPEHWTCPECGGTEFVGVHGDGF